MKSVLIVAAAAVFVVAAILLFAGSAAVNPLGLIACGLAAVTVSGFVR